MDITTILGLILGIAFLAVAFVMEGGQIGSLFQITAFIIVFGSHATLADATP